MNEPLPVVWLVTPVYFDHPCFLRLKEEVRAALAGQSLDVRFLLIDDSAGADPSVAAEADKAEVLVFTPPFNLGHQRALVFGLRKLASQIKDDDLVVTMDADGEDRPDDLPRLLRELQQEPLSMRTVVLARRTTRQVSLPFRVLYFFFSMAFRALTGTIIRTGNFAAYRGSLVRRVLFHPHFDVCYSSSLLSLNLELRFVQCARGSRYEGQSKMSYLRLMAHGVSMFMPFLDRVAIRTLLLLAVIFMGCLVSVLVLPALQVLLGRDYALFQLWPFFMLAATALMATPSPLLLFALYSQARGAALTDLEDPRTVRPSR